MLMMFREVLKDFIICGIFILRGIVFFFFLVVVLWMVWVWGEDVDEFKLERWENLVGMEVDSFYVFGVFMYGLRICIGK